MALTVHPYVKDGLMRLEKRKSARNTFSLPIRFKIFQLDRLESDIRDKSLNHQGDVQDLSLGGVQVVSPSVLKAGDLLELELEVPGKGALRTVARIAWSRLDDASKEGEYRSGIEFLPVYEEDLEKLKDYFGTGEPS